MQMTNATQNSSPDSEKKPRKRTNNEYDIQLDTDSFVEAATSSRARAYSSSVHVDSNKLLANKNESIRSNPAKSSMSKFNVLVSFD